MKHFLKQDRSQAAWNAEISLTIVEEHHELKYSSKQRKRSKFQIEFLLRFFLKCDQLVLPCLQVYE